jgi:hypothetical protein
MGWREKCVIIMPKECRRNNSINVFCQKFVIFVQARSGFVKFNTLVVLNKVIDCYVRVSREGKTVETANHKESCNR